jgi:hypothetical protein
MPAASKQQQKFFGVVKAMQAGDLPKKGAAGKVAKDMSKKDVDKYASTKHKGLPKKVKKETMKISELKNMIKEEILSLLEAPMDKTFSKDYEGSTKAFINHIKHELQSAKGSNKTVLQKMLKNLQTVAGYPKLMSRLVGMNEAKMTPAKVQKAQKELVATIQLLKKNFPMYKAAKDSGDEKKLEKHRKIALDLTKKKKQLELALDQALGGLYQDAELDLKEGKVKSVTKQMWNAMNDDERVNALLTAVKDPDDAEDNAESEYDDLPDEVIANMVVYEGKINEATLPKFKTPYEAYSWIMNKRGEAMDIETEMLNISGEIHDKYKDMEQEAEAGGGPVADRYGKEIEALENKHKELRAQFAAIMAEIDEYDQNY